MKMRVLLLPCMPSVLDNLESDRSRSLIFFAVISLIMDSDT